MLPLFTAWAPGTKLFELGTQPTFPGDFVSDIELGHLPHVSWVLSGGSQTEHPGHGPPAAGEVASRRVVEALISNPQVWKRSALLITYDENGGFFDHVPPPTAPKGTKGEDLTAATLPPESAGIRGPIGLGFRVPMLVVSPFSRGGLVCSDTFDHTSTLRLLETRFGVEVPNLSAWRRRVTGDLTSAFNASQALRVYRRLGGLLAARPMPQPRRCPRIVDLMRTLIVSYDGTPNDDDALALGKLLSAAGFELALAYVRHSREFDPSREELAQHDAQRRLDHGASWLGKPETPRHVVISPSTGEGLRELAEREGASLVVFGSDYRTAPGHVEPGTSAQHMLDGGSHPIAIAAAGLRTKPANAITSLAVPLAGAHNDVARQTAAALAEKLGAKVVESRAEPVDLIVVGSQPGAPDGRIVIGGDVRSELDGARSSVLVLPAGAPLVP
jgi:hypothetical protein